jgi:plasmid replication DNA-binding protein KfrA
MSDPAKPYGEGRIRSNVSYADVERAAIAILKSERRPTVETVRDALGGGSPDTIGTALRRFWRDLGARIDGDPAALTRMPSDIADLADGMWQHALKLAGEAANHDDNAARERLRQLELENEIKQRSFDLREREIDIQARERERALADARDHLLSLSKALSREQATNQVHERRIADLEMEVAQYREQIAALIAGAIAQNRSRQTRRTTKRADKANPRGNTARVRQPEPAKRKAAPKKSTTINRTSRRPSRHAPRKTSGRKRR